MTDDNDRLAAAIKEIKLDWISERRQEFHAADLIDGFLAYLHAKLTEQGVGFVDRGDIAVCCDHIQQIVDERGLANDCWVCHAKYLHGLRARLRKAVARAESNIGTLISGGTTHVPLTWVRDLLAAISGEWDTGNEGEPSITGEESQWANLAERARAEWSRENPFD